MIVVNLTTVTTILEELNTLQYSVLGLSLPIEISLLALASAQRAGSVAAH